MKSELLSRALYRFSAWTWDIAADLEPMEDFETEQIELQPARTLTQFQPGDLQMRL